MLLRSAARKGQTELVESLLVAGAQINHRDKQGLPIIYHAATKGHITTVSYLIEQGADLKLLDKNDPTLVQILLAKYQPQYIKLFKQLIALQTNIHLVDSGGRTPLHLAARYADVALIDFLLEQGIDFSVQDNNGQIALHASARNANIHVFDYLVRVCQHIKNASDKAGETVVHKVARLGDLELLRLCLEYDLNFLALNYHGKTPLDIATQDNYTQNIIEIIHEGMRRSQLQEQEDLNDMQTTPSASPRLSISTFESRKVRLVCQRNKNITQTTQEQDEQQSYYFGAISDRDFLVQALIWDDEDDEDVPGMMHATSH